MGANASPEADSTYKDHGELEHKRGKLLPIALGIVVLGTLIYLGYTMFAKSVVYYKTPTEVANGPVGAHVRVSGNVVNDSIHMNTDADDYTFQIADSRTTLTIVATGGAPDTLKNGAQAVAEGSLGTDGEFHATSVFAKCPSKFGAQTPTSGVSG
jgi:cytochrome c-type biogenesis protein CcmE